jgi:hypothetical protein
MSKEKESQKNNKKAPAKNLKEKRAAKEAKRRIRRVNYRYFWLT